MGNTQAILTKKTALRLERDRKIRTEYDRMMNISGSMAMAVVYKLADDFDLTVSGIYRALNRTKAEQTAA